MENEKKWYVVHIYSGYEKKVQTNLEKRIETTGMQDKIFTILIPEEEVQVKDGVKKTVVKKVYPGYVLVEMIMTDDSWYIVRNTPGVTGFVGAGSKPVPLEDYEVEKIFKLMGLKKQSLRFDVNVGDKIQVTEGPFEDFMGTITAIDMDKGKIHVLVSMFGRETPLELDFDQIREIE
ncbi:transcription termination/antitermination protein NusG [endosymbiont 'TC1' of Trimyema compressum]|uniref:transcription termination/antitermination protein NusG n=1 Tax=endosymbiont 'TC1' of Trimyema compressum TaxID=243899 RepID=UPI0007F0A5E5|nr:transcription termination/antitermination protein NusG [endosymbiont 'TC1' of Trimyema compressum]AMP20311.1 transcription termination/antitermination protein NusG [endosymbiont 'TC1' of Trimyema compressum]